jgi:hypothetical protein
MLYSEYKVTRAVLAKGLCLLIWTSLVFCAQDLRTGPPVGTELTSVMGYAESGPFRGREFDLAKEIGNGDGALLFIHQLTRNGIPTLRALDDYAEQYGILGFRSFTLLLTDDRTNAENRIAAGNGSLKLRNPILVCLDGPEGPGNLALNRKCIQSLLMIKDGRVAKSIALTDIADEDREQVRLWIEEIAGPLPTEASDYVALVKSRLPEDPALLRQFVQRQSTELHRVHAALDVATGPMENGRANGRARMTKRGTANPKKTPKK